MSETAAIPASGNSWMRKKYLGIPALYLAGAVVGAMLIVAYLGSKKPVANTTGPTTEPTTDPYNNMASSGVVYVPQVAAAVSPAPATSSNSDWLRSGVQYLISQGVNPGDAQTALQKYLEGVDMSYTEGSLRDQVVTQIGLPPVPTSIGSTAPKDAANSQWSQLTTYSTFYREASTGKIIGITKSGTEHWVLWNEWLAMGHPDHLITTSVDKSPTYKSG